MKVFLVLAVYIVGALWLIGPDPEQQAVAVCERHGMALYTDRPIVVCRNEQTGEEIPLSKLS